MRGQKVWAKRRAYVGLCGITAAVCIVCVWEGVYLYNWINCPWRQDMVSEQPTAALCWLLVGAFIMTLWGRKHKRGTDLQHRLDSSSFFLPAAMQRN